VKYEVPEVLSTNDKLQSTGRVSVLSKIMVRKQVLNDQFRTRFNRVASTKYKVQITKYKVPEG